MVARDTGFDDAIPYVLTTCTYEYRDGTEIERTRLNWVGTIAALSFIVGVYFGAAGIFRMIDLRRAVILTGICVLVCISMVVIFFA